MSKHCTVKCGGPRHHGRCKIFLRSSVQLRDHRNAYIRQLQRAWSLTPGLQAVLDILFATSSPFPGQEDISPWSLPMPALCVCLGFDTLAGSIMGILSGWFSSNDAHTEQTSPKGPAAASKPNVWRSVFDPGSNPNIGRQGSAFYDKVAVSEPSCKCIWYHVETATVAGVWHALRVHVSILSSPSHSLQYVNGICMVACSSDTP